MYQRQVFQQRYVPGHYIQWAVHYDKFTQVSQFAHAGGQGGHGNVMKRQCRQLLQLRKVGHVGRQRCGRVQKVKSNRRWLVCDPVASQQA
jgi:hypothetical protein